MNGTEGVQGARIVTEIVSPLPAGYELLFLDGAIYDANQAAFQQDPDGYNLTAYPSVDAATGGRADPYKPAPGQGQSVNGYVRYISDYQFDWNMLADGLVASRAVSQSLDGSVAGKLTNIRGVQAQSGAIQDGTVVSQVWALVPSSFDPNSPPDGIPDDVPGPGDDTLPAWSTRLLGNPRVVTVTANDINHMDMINHAGGTAGDRHRFEPIVVGRDEAHACDRQDGEDQGG